MEFPDDLLLTDDMPLSFNDVAISPLQFRDSVVRHPCKVSII